MEQIARYAFNFTFNQISSYLCKCLDLWIFLLIFQHVLFGLVKQTLLVFVMCISGGQILRRFCFSCKYSTYFTVYIYIYIYIYGFQLALAPVGEWNPPYKLVHTPQKYIRQPWTFPKRNIVWACFNFVLIHSDAIQRGFIKL